MRGKCFASRRMASPRFSFFFLLTLLVSCGQPNRHDPAIGEAYVGPSSVNLRKDIPPKSPTVATVHFGDKVEIVSTKRRFVRVRIKAGSEGWIDQNMLLGQSDMDQIKAQSEAARA